MRFTGARLRGTLCRGKEFGLIQIIIRDLRDFGLDMYSTVGTQPRK